MRHPFITRGGTVLRRRKALVTNRPNPFAGDTLHFDASKGLTIDGVTNDVAAWPDIERGVHSAVQATDANQPTPGSGPPHLDFDNTNDWLATDDEDDFSIDNGENFSLMIAVNATDNGEVDAIIANVADGVGDASPGSGGDGFDLIFQGNVGGNPIVARFETDTPESASITFDSSDPSGAWHVLAFVFDWSGNVEGWLNGVSQGTSGVSAFIGDMPAGGGFHIGVNGTEDGSFFGGFINQIAFDRSAWSVAELNRRGRAMAQAVGATWTNVS